MLLEYAWGCWEAAKRSSRASWPMALNPVKEEGQKGRVEMTVGALESRAKACYSDAGRWRDWVRVLVDW